MKKKIRKRLSIATEIAFNLKFNKWLVRNLSDLN